MVLAVTRKGHPGPVPAQCLLSGLALKNKYKDICAVKNQQTTDGCYARGAHPLTRRSPLGARGTHDRRRGRLRGRGTPRTPRPGPTWAPPVGAAEGPGRPLLFLPRNTTTSTAGGAAGGGGMAAAPSSARSSPKKSRAPRRPRLSSFSSSSAAPALPSPSSAEPRALVSSPACRNAYGGSAGRDRRHSASE